ncbi:hypothetical protein GCM10022396_04930 [Flavivirga amylovorans]
MIMKKIVQILIISILIFGCSKDNNINNLEFEAINIDISSPYNNFQKYDIEEIVYSHSNRPKDELLHTKITFDTINISEYENSVVSLLGIKVPYLPRSSGSKGIFGHYLPIIVSPAS